MIRSSQLLTTALLAVLGCNGASTSTDTQVDPTTDTDTSTTPDTDTDTGTVIDTDTGTTPTPSLVDEVRDRIQQHGILPVSPAPAVSDELYDLGRNLAFDKILSGNLDIACLTCHHPTLGTTDGRSLSFGQGASSLGPLRTGGQRVPRNAPALFNLHTYESMFWDSRVLLDGSGTFHTPAGLEITPEMAATLEHGAVAAQAMFPVTSRLEMRGDPGENEVADVATDDNTGVWAALMARLGAIPGYVTRFEAAYPTEAFQDMTFAHAANAIAAFEFRAFEFRDSPWDQFVAGDDAALGDEALEGAVLFFDVGCVDCHSGSAFSDFAHHNTGLTQFGPGRGDGDDGRDDFGYEGNSGLVDDRYTFRTPPLFNIELTAPYGHLGQFSELEAHVAHYVDVQDALLFYDITANVVDTTLWDSVHPNQVAVVSTLDPDVEDLAWGTDPDTEVAKITTFLLSLTDEAARDLEHLVPENVASGLPVDD